ncbi:MAG TPA: helix-turn-helix transcriptional regulator [Firmicutes bacterium]|nr:helix-turn-helix transcriptional regulator [Bacillota bacterium]
MKNILSRHKQIGKSLKQEFRKKTETGISLNLRLFLFLAVLVLTIIFSVIAVLLATGTFTAGLSESERIVENELLRVSKDISDDYGQLSLQAIEYSRKLSLSIEEKAGKLGISLPNLQDHPEKLEEIISGEFDQSLLSLLIAKSSGVFFIIDATVNPVLERVKSTRAGLYIKNMEPNIISSSPPNIIMLRGFPSIGRKKSVALHAQWKMEFDIRSAPYYYRPMEAASLNPELPLSRLYYWSTPLKLTGASEVVMLCTVPLIDSGGNVFGVCGFEISEMLFKLSYMPGNSIFKRLFCVFSPVTEDTLEFHHSMFAGGYSAKMISGGKDDLNISGQRRFFYTYKKQDQDASFLGIHAPVQLYPRDSVFSGEQWVAAVMVPESDITSSVTRLNLLLFSSLMLLVIIGIISSIVLSERLFLKPISKGFDIIRSTDLSVAPRTKIPEIDNLIDFLALHNQELYEKARQENLTFSTLDEFLEKIDELTPAERDVFNLYAEGYTGQEIARKLYLSINTIKTHSKRIYTKLNIASREELLLYVNLLKEIGKEVI